jgi:hypothetical protein
LTDSALTRLVAWWGAILSTIIFLWDIYKWKTSGPRLKVDISANMQYFEQGTGRVDDKDYIVLNISNTGQRLTTITNVGMQYFESRIKRMLRKPTASFIVPTPNQHYPTPHKLEAGTTWMATIIQTADLVTMAEKGFLDCLIYYSQSNKPFRKRVLIAAEKKKGLATDGNSTETKQ